MSTIKTFTPPTPVPYTIDEETKLEVPTPQEMPKETDKNVLQRVIQIITIIVMIGMMALMYTMMQQRSSSTGMTSPMMFMMPVMMGIGLLSSLGQATGSSAELNALRKDYAITLNSIRKNVHQEAERFYQMLQRSYPNPHTLYRFVGSTDNTQAVMWQSTPENRGGVVIEQENDEPVKLHETYLTARIGKSVVNLQPSLEHKELPPTEKIEPTTGSQFRRFIRTQGFLTNAPFGVSIENTYSIAFAGADVEKRRRQARAMLMNLAFNHSPDHLRIAVVTDDTENPDWAWLKWLPHAQHPTDVDEFGSSRLIFPTVAHFLHACPDSMQYAGNSDMRYVCVIDRPQHKISKDWKGADPATCFMVVSAKVNEMTPKANVFTITQDDKIIIPGIDADIAADYVTVEEAEVFSRAMACYVPVSATDTNNTVTAPVNFRRKNWFEMIGINNLDEWDPVTDWNRNYLNNKLEIPIGYARNGDNISPDTAVYMNLVDANHRGTGPHGRLQGRSGTGKSFLLRSLVLNYARYYHPNHLNFVLVDFKGESAFGGLDVLPHTIAVISNLGQAADMLKRLEAVIMGENERRQEAFKTLQGSKDIYNYHEELKENPNMEPMPFIFVVIDEFAEFVTTNTWFRKTLDSLARVGRSTGIFLLVASQSVDSALLGDASKQMSYGISLGVNSARESMNVIGSDDAANESKPGSAFIRFGAGFDPNGNDVTGHLAAFKGFKIDDAYEVIEHDDEEIKQVGLTVVEDEVVDSSLEVFTAGYDKQVEVVEETSAVEPVKRQEKVSAKDQMATKLIAKIGEQYGTFTPLDLWQPPLRIPITYQTESFTQALQQYAVDPDRMFDIRVPIGETDAPYQHKRVPFVVDFSQPATHNWVIAGHMGSGKTYALKSLIANTAMVGYDQTQVSYLVVDMDGNGLRDVAMYPHVRMYVSAQPGFDDESDGLLRALGEVERVIKVRQRVLSENEDISSVNEYLMRKLEDPGFSPDDPYGKLVLVFDDYSVYRDLIGMDGYHDFDQRMQTLINTGTRYGVHFVVTTTDVSTKLGNKVQALFGGKIVLRVTDVNSVPDRTIGQAAKDVPAGEPGSGVDMLNDLLFSRVMLPIDAKVEPARVDAGMEFYDPAADYSKAIASQGKHIQEFYAREGRLDVVPQVRVPSSDLSYQELWSLFESEVLKGRKLRTAGLPVGVSIETGEVVNAARGFGHVVVSGENPDFRIMMLRSMMQSVALQNQPPKNASREQLQQWKKSAAKFVLFDPSGVMVAERERLKKWGLLAGYATNQEELGGFVDQLSSVLRSRIPNRDAVLSREQVRSRSWYSGPDFYVVLADFKAAMPENSFEGSVFDDFVDVLRSREGLGCFVWANVSYADAADFVASRNSLAQFLQKVQRASHVVFSGTKTTAVKLFGDVLKFRPLRPGKVQVGLGDAGRVVSVQVADVGEWD